MLKILSFFLTLSSLSFALAEEYDAMKGVNPVNGFFAMGNGIPRIAALHMKLIGDRHKELLAMKRNENAE
jgi:hypothetical protein